VKSLYDFRAVSDLELDGVFYILHKNQKLARISKSSKLWKAWFYKDKFSICENKLSLLLEKCEKYLEKRK
jgi:Fe-S cluster biosynthesis and repair protein YggX